MKVKKCMFSSSGTSPGLNQFHKQFCNKVIHIITDFFGAFPLAFFFYMDFPVYLKKKVISEDLNLQTIV